MSETWKENVIKTKLGGKKEWTDQERLELCHQLDKDLNSHIDSAVKRNARPTLDDRWTEENWKEKMAEHPIFTQYLQKEDTAMEAPLNDLSEGLAQLKYGEDHNSPTEVALNYKEEGVSYFKYKKYRLAITSFTEGLKAKCQDHQLNAQLYNNRAAAHFFLKNYRSAIRDSQKAIELKPDYMKAIQRGIQSTLHLKCWDEVIEWCDKGLSIESYNQELIKKRSLAVREKRKYDRDGRKKVAEMQKQLHHDTRLLNEIAKRNINISPTSNIDDDAAKSPNQILLQDLQPCYPAAKMFPVHLNTENELIWPVVLLYPEYNESDSILEFNENSRFIDHLEAMFGEEEASPVWDTHNNYKSQRLVLFFEDVNKKELVSQSVSSCLKEALSDSRYVVKSGTPEFLVFVDGSDFLKNFLARY